MYNKYSEYVNIFTSKSSKLEYVYKGLEYRKYIGYKNCIRKTKQLNCGGDLYGQRFCIRN